MLPVLHLSVLILKFSVKFDTFVGVSLDFSVEMLYNSTDLGGVFLLSIYDQERTKTVWYE